MRVWILSICFIVIGVTIACSQSVETKAKAFIDAYYATRSVDAMNSSAKSRTYLADTFYNPGKESDVRFFVISRQIAYESIRKDVGIIDSDTGKEGDVLQVDLTLKVLGEILGSTYMVHEGLEHEVFIDLVSENNGLRINTDSSFNDVYIFESDYNRQKK